MDAVTRKGLRLLSISGALLVALVIFIYWAGRERLPRLDEHNARAIDPFTLTERSGRPVSLQDLRGHVWVADFFYTDCTGLCRNLSQQMARLAEKTTRWPDVRLVSISVDPERDTPQVLRAYAATYNADPERWLFLTGSRKAVERVVQRNFLLAMSENPDPAAAPQDRITHSSRLVLIDAAGRIRHYYDALALESLQALLAGIQALRAESAAR